jgi:hypothetical protein
MMRARAVVVLSLGLAASGVLGACQIIVGLSGLTVTSGTGGSATTASSASASAGGSGGSSGTGGGDAGDAGMACTPGMPCGGECVGNIVFQPATCTGAGTCPATSSACTTDTVCIDPPAMMDGGPAAGPMCVPCGTFPNMSTSVCPSGCADCDADGGVCVTPCDGGVCATSCPDGGCAPGPLLLDASKSAIRYECTGPMGCNNLVAQCAGPFPCTIECDGGCVGLQLTCEGPGPCTLACGDMSCKDATVTCGANACNVTCTQKGPATVACGDSCGCNAQAGCVGP